MLRGGEVRRLEDGLHVLSDAARAFVAATLDYDRLLETISETLAKAINDCCTLSLVAEGEGSLAPASHHAAGDHPTEQLHAFGEPCPVGLDQHAMTEEVFRTGVGLLIPRLGPGKVRPAVARASADHLNDRRVHSVIIVALRVQGRSIGVLTLLRYRPESPPFDENDRDLAQLLADQAALAIDNSRLIKSRRNAEARFDRLSDAELLGVVVCDLNGRVTEINDKLLSLVGYTRDEVLSGATSWLAMTPPGWREMDSAPARS